MFKGFKLFLLRGNVIDLAVAVVIGVAFGAVVTALVKDLITPLIAAIGGKPDFSAIQFTINGSKFLIGDFVNAVISFLMVAAAVYFFDCGAHECAHGADPSRRSPTRSDHQEVLRMPERDSDRRQTLLSVHQPGSVSSGARQLSARGTRE